MHEWKPDFYWKHVISLGVVCDCSIWKYSTKAFHQPDRFASLTVTLLRTNWTQTPYSSHRIFLRRVSSIFDFDNISETALHDGHEIRFKIRHRSPKMEQAEFVGMSYPLPFASLPSSHIKRPPLCGCCRTCKLIRKSRQCTQKTKNI